jgi:hypothetical protein
MDVSTAGWMAAQGIGQTDYFADGPQLARLRAQQQEAATAQQEREEEAARAERRDARETAMYLAGVQPGATLERAMQISDVRAEIAGHREEIARLERRLGRFRQQAEVEAEAMSRADTMMSRSAALDPVEAALQRARQAHGEFARNTRVARSDAALGRRPKGGGYAVRGEPPECEGCKAIGADAWESWQLHHTTPDGRPVAEEPDRPVPAPVPDAERAREVDRLVGAGFSRETAEWATPEISR